MEGLTGGIAGAVEVQCEPNPGPFAGAVRTMELSEQLLSGLPYR